MKEGTVLYLFDDCVRTDSDGNRDYSEILTVNGRIYNENLCSIEEITVKELKQGDVVKIYTIYQNSFNEIKSISGEHNQPLNHFGDYAVVRTIEVDGRKSQYRNNTVIHRLTVK